VAPEDAGLGGRLRLCRHDAAGAGAGAGAGAAGMAYDYVHVGGGFWVRVRREGGWRLSLLVSPNPHVCRLLSVLYTVHKDKGHM